MKVLDNSDSKSLTHCYERVEKQAITVQVECKCQKTTVLFENIKPQTANTLNTH